jgi:hypothetical protein
LKKQQARAIAITAIGLTPRQADETPKAAWPLGTLALCGGALLFTQPGLEATLVSVAVLSLVSLACAAAVPLRDSDGFPARLLGLGSTIAPVFMALLLWMSCLVAASAGFGPEGQFLASVGLFAILAGAELMLSSAIAWGLAASAGRSGAIACGILVSTRFAGLAGRFR